MLRAAGISDPLLDFNRLRTSTDADRVALELVGQLAVGLGVMLVWSGSWWSRLWGWKRRRSLGGSPLPASTQTAAKVAPGDVLP